MSVPKKRLSKRRTRARRSHHGLTPVQTATCPKCSNTVQPHHACPSCGHYRDKDVLNLQEKVEKKIAPKTEKAPAATAEKTEEKNADAPAAPAPEAEKKTDDKK